MAKLYASKAVSVALAQAGYHEKASNSQLQSKTANSGSNNWNKFADYIDRNHPEFYNFAKNGYDWCDIFYDCCLIMASDMETARKAIYQPYKSCGAGCKYSADYYRQNGAFIKRGKGQPKPGDQIFFGPYGNEYHTGMVIKVLKDRVYTVEGNSSEMVAKRNYSLSYSDISGYGRPKYSAENETSKSTTPATTTTAKTYTKGSDNEHTIYNFLTQVMGLNKAGACGILANIYCESSFNPVVLGDGGTSYGICQWHAGRYTNLKNWCSKNKKDYKTLDGQLWYLKYELEKSYTSVLNYIKGVANSAAGAYNAGYYWCKHFEIPADTENTSVKRGNLAKNTYYPKYGSSAKPSTPSTAKKSVDVIAKEVIDGKWGNGDDRKKKLIAAGYDYNAVQKKVNELLSGKSAAKTTTYTVKKGDTLWAIAQSKLGDGNRYKEIKTLNKLTSDTIYAGQKLKIPIK